MDQVRSALPEKLAAAIASAGIEQGKLTIGVTGAAWASRLRYLTESVREQVAQGTGVTILTVRIKVIAPFVGT